MIKPRAKSYSFFTTNPTIERNDADTYTMKEKPTYLASRKTLFLYFFDPPQKKIDNET